MKKAITIFTVILLLINSLGAFYGGSFMMMDPSGKLMGLNTYKLLNSPFIDYFWPGFILFFVNGICSLVGAIALIKRAPYFRYLVAGEGILLTGWIGVQVEMLEVFNALHLIMGSIGICLVLLGVFVLGDKPSTLRIN